MQIIKLACGLNAPLGHKVQSSSEIAQHNPSLVLPVVLPSGLLCVSVTIDDFSIT